MNFMFDLIKQNQLLVVGIFNRYLLNPVCRPRCCMRFLTSSVNSALSESRDMPCLVWVEKKAESLLFMARLLRRLVQCMLFLRKREYSDWSLPEELCIGTFGSSPFSLVSAHPSVIPELWDLKENNRKTINQ